MKISWGERSAPMITAKPVAPSRPMTPTSMLRSPATLRPSRTQSKPASIRFHTFETGTLRWDKTLDLGAQRRQWGRSRLVRRHKEHSMASSIVVLVVEDDWMIREDVVDELRRAGLTVLETATAE